MSELSNLGAGSYSLGAVTLPPVHCHVAPSRRHQLIPRLIAAKAECDLELQRITNSIAAFLQEILREGDDAGLRMSSDVNPPAVSSASHHVSRTIPDDSVDPLMSALYDIISIATAVTEVTLTHLTDQPKLCEEFVQRVRAIGKLWDDHPDWQGQTWYVQALLAIASLSRVVEWRETEKQFWNIDDSAGIGEDEVLTFVTQPAKESRPGANRRPDSKGGNVREHPNKLKSVRPSSQRRKSKDEQPRELSLSNPSGEEASSRAASKIVDEPAPVLTADRLQPQSEVTPDQFIVVELNLDGDHFIWANSAWRAVVGSSPDDLRGKQISHMLAPSEQDVFRAATKRLQKDSSHTVELRFKLQIVPEGNREPASVPVFQPMEGRGMLMVDRVDSQPSHTMWVFKQIDLIRHETESTSAILETSRQATRFPPNQPVGSETILCRICDCQVPKWYLRKHSEICAEMRHQEVEISDCNESISKLQSTIRELSAAVDRPSPGAAPEYRGISLLPPSTPQSLFSKLRHFRTNKLQRKRLKRVQRDQLQELDILQVALEMSTPSRVDEESKEPTDRPRPVSPALERKILQARNWCKPTVDGAAFEQLVQDVELLVRQKVDGVVRMQNMIGYAEKIWQESKEKIADTPVAGGEEEGGSGDEDPDKPPKLRIKTRISTQDIPETKPLVSPDDGRDIHDQDSTAVRHAAVGPADVSTSEPLSPTQHPASPPSKKVPSTIKDFDILRSISKGPFGSVFLAKKQTTNDYYAVKVLKKVDVIAKNQITNVKAQRMILIKQIESPFVARLFYTFQSKENLYLVMEYLNGGDCAALIKCIGALPEEWTRNYIAEVVLGLENLHQQGVIHRDLRPSNLLIDQHGHLKLTDSGLSRGGLLSRQMGIHTPDYLAPETILGSREDNAVVDWWALGVITYEFLHGRSPFRDETPAKVYGNILSGHITCHESSPGARDFMQGSMSIYPSVRLGVNGAEEVKAHPFFEGIQWEQVTTAKALFLPQVSDPKNNDYFQARGVIPELFAADHVTPSVPATSSPPITDDRGVLTPPASDDFGTFNFKNLPVLKQANDDIIHKLKADQLAASNAHAVPESSFSHRGRKRDIRAPSSVVPTPYRRPAESNPSSPATSTSSIASSPSRANQPPLTPESGNSYRRKLSEHGVVERFHLNRLAGSEDCNSASLRTNSQSSTGNDSDSDNWSSPPSHVSGRHETDTPDPRYRAVKCLLAEDNPITAKIIETLLIRLGCQCVVAADGSEAIAVAMGESKFECILMDLHMPVLDGEEAARHIKASNSKNANTPIVAISAYNGVNATNTSEIFAASLTKPLQKADLLGVMHQLGFKSSAIDGPGKTKLTTHVEGMYGGRRGRNMDHVTRRHHPRVNVGRHRRQYSSHSDSSESEDSSNSAESRHSSARSISSSRSRVV